MHRLIGTEYSAPLSVKLDDWDDEHIAHMLRGNDAVNAELEVALPPGLYKHKNHQTIHHFH